MATALGMRTGQGTEQALSCPGPPSPAPCSGMSKNCPLGFRGSRNPGAPFPTIGIPLDWSSLTSKIRWSRAEAAEWRKVRLYSGGSTSAHVQLRAVGPPHPSAGPLAPHPGSFLCTWALEPDSEPRPGLEATTPFYRWESKPMLWLLPWADPRGQFVWGPDGVRMGSGWGL